MAEAKKAVKKAVKKEKVEEPVLAVINDPEERAIRDAGQK